MITTDQKGAIAELAIAHTAASLGIGVFKPLTDGERYDLIFDLRPHLVRVQCKTAVLSGSTLRVPCFSTRRCRDGFARRQYSTNEIDAIAAYNFELDRSFYIPLVDVSSRTYVQLRLSPCLNNQRIGVHWADEFALDARLRSLVGP